MYDPTVWLYAAKNRKDIPTDEKLRTILDLHFPNGQTPVILRTPRGKPYLPNHPGTHISVTHSGKWFVCALSPCPIGIDLQEHTLLRNESPEQAAQRFCKIARRFFHSDEAAYVEADPSDRFFRVWTAKESYVKYTGQGMDQNFDKFCVLADRNTGIPVNECWCAEDVFFLQTRFDAAYTFCMCTQNPCRWQWRSFELHNI